MAGRNLITVRNRIIVEPMELCQRFTAIVEVPRSEYAVGGGTGDVIGERTTVQNSPAEEESGPLQVITSFSR